MSDHRVFTIEPAARDHLDSLAEVERAASSLFSPDDLPPHLRSETLPRETLERAQREGRVWVALGQSGAVAGFAMTDIIDGCAHLGVMGVDPAHARRGVGTALLDRALEWATSRGLPAMVLTTFSHLPWNAPFYAREGFREITSAGIGPELAEILREEAAIGLRNRIAMKRDIP